jgi:hypothetical protein
VGDTWGIKVLVTMGMVTHCVNQRKNTLFVALCVGALLYDKRVSLGVKDLYLC